MSYSIIEIEGIGRELAAVCLLIRAAGQLLATSSCASGQTITHLGNGDGAVLG